MFFPARQLLTISPPRPPLDAALLSAMATRKQIQANRLNARKSTGPRTSEGKARSSMNALRTGIDAESHLIPGEWNGDLHRIRTEYYDRYHPVTPAQRMFADTLIDSEWLLRRLRKVEASLWTQSIPKSVPLTPAMMSEAYEHLADQFTRLQRRIDATQRNYRHALHELERLQKEESPDLDPEPETVSAQRETTNPEDGFVPQTVLQTKLPTTQSPRVPTPQ
jgi:hypothetical protein